MKKQELAKDIVHYTFRPQPNTIFETSVTAVLNGNKAVLIDTAYEFQASELFDDLNKNNIEIEKIIITHFHDDHMQGLKGLPKVTVYGSSRFQETLDMWTPKNEHCILTPSVVINEPQTIIFGNHSLTLTPFPGHSLCGMIVNIDNQFIHIADELMFSPDGVPLLPSSDGNDFVRHLNSLDRLRSYSSFTLIPSHGPAFKGEKLEEEINNRYIYLNALVQSNKNINYEDAVKDCRCTFLHSEWHEGNCE